MEPVEFLRARYADDERIARAAIAQDGVWTRDCGHLGIDDEVLPPGHDLCTVVTGDIHIYDEGGHTPEQAEHIARHDPARVLREVEAKRGILDECAYWYDRVNSAEANPPPGLADRFEVAMSVLRLLALPYVDHPDYQQEWAPE